MAENLTLCSELVAFRRRAKVEITTENQGIRPRHPREVFDHHGCVYYHNLGEIKQARHVVRPDTEHSIVCCRGASSPPQSSKERLVESFFRHLRQKGAKHQQKKPL